MSRALAAVKRISILAMLQQTSIKYIPVFIVPHEYVTVNCEPSSADRREHAHHAVTLHI